MTEKQALNLCRVLFDRSDSATPEETGQWMAHALVNCMVCMNPDLGTEYTQYLWTQQMRDLHSATALTNRLLLAAFLHSWANAIECKEGTTCQP